MSSLLIRGRRTLYRPALVVGAAVAAACPRTGLAHGGPPTPDTIWSSWNSDPLLLAGLAFIAYLYTQGVIRLWSRAGFGRGIPLWQAAAFLSGLATLAIALISPVDSLGEALFSGHMVQHLQLMLVAAPLIVLGAPAAGLLWGLPEPLRRHAGRLMRNDRLRSIAIVLTLPLVAWILHTAAVWLWHIPMPYQAALRNDWLHAAEHASFFGTALLFWWAVIMPQRQRRDGHGMAVLSLFTMALQGGALGVLLLTARQPLYPDYGNRPAAWGLTLLEDQQLAGLIMWVPGGIVYLFAALATVTAWLSASDRSARLRQQPHTTAAQPVPNTGAVRP